MMYLPLPANELNQVSLLSYNVCSHLRKQNLAKYADCSALVGDLMILQQVLRNIIGYYCQMLLKSIDMELLTLPKMCFV